MSSLTRVQEFSLLDRPGFELVDKVALASTCDAENDNDPVATVSHGGWRSK